MNYIKKILFLTLNFIPLNFLYAGDGSTGGALVNPLKTAFQTVPGLINGILQIIVQVGSVILVVFVVLAGLKFVMARGNESKLTEAKQAFVYTLVGAAIVLGAFVISEAIEATVGQLST